MSREVGMSGGWVCPGRWAYLGVCLGGSGGGRLCPEDTTGCSLQAGGMHPTGMHSGFLYF